MALGSSIIRMGIGMRGSGKMEILMGMERIIIALERLIWAIIMIIRGMEEGDISIRMVLYMMETGKTETKKE